MHRSYASYRAKSFLIETNESSMVYEVKRTRAIFDESLAIPGTDRRGGWRCPPGTRYGGQITDRFGRNCGWGVARRLGNAITNIGERLENVDDRRRGRRVARRNERMVRRLQEGGRIERAARRVADVLETDDNKPRQITPARATPELPAAPRRRRGNLRQSERRRMDREIDQPNAPRTDVDRTPPAPAPERPAAPRVRRQRAVRERGNLRPSERRRMEREMEEPGAPRTDEGRVAPAKKVPAKKVPAKKKAAAKKAPAKKRVAKKVAAPKKAATPRKATEPRLATAPRQPTPPEDQQVAALRSIIDAVENGNALDQENLRVIANRLGMSNTELNGIISRGRVNGQEQGASIVRFLESRVAFDEISAEAAQQEIDDAILRLTRQELSGQAAVLDETRIEDRENGFKRAIEAAAAKVVLRALRQNFNPRNTPAAPAAPAEPAVPVAGRIALDLPFDDVLRNVRVGNRVGEANENKLGLRAGDLERLRDQGRQSAEEFIQEAERRARQGDFDEEKLVDDNNALLQEINGAFEEAQQAARRIQTKITEGRRDNKTDDEIREAIKDDEREFVLKVGQMVQKRAMHGALIGDGVRNRILMNAPPRPVEDLAPEPVRREAVERVAKILRKRENILADYLDQRYGEGNAPWRDMNAGRYQELVADLRSGNTDEAEAARAALKEWAENAYSHERIVGTNDKTYRIKAVATVDDSGFINVTAEIFHIRSDGRSEKIGDSTRKIPPGGRVIENALLKIESPSHKKSGIATIYNHHAFMYARAAGFEEVRTSSAWDGPWVWARFGFRASITNDSIRAMRSELDNFDGGNTRGLIQSTEDAEIVRFLLNRQSNARGNPLDMPRHLDFIAALTNPHPSGSDDYKRRAKQIEDWFRSNMSFGSGTFYFDENEISLDPRRNRR